MTTSIREIDKNNPEELRIVTERCMAAVLETIPEFGGQTQKAKEHLSNFTHEEMAAMIRNDFDDKSKRIMVALVGEEIIGQALYSVKTDTEGKTYGFCFSRYIAPEYRRKGIAELLLGQAIDWFRSQGAEYAVAQTHITNTALQRLFTKFGFTTSGPFAGSWQYYILRKDLKEE